MIEETSGVSVGFMVLGLIYFCGLLIFYKISLEQHTPLTWVSQPHPLMDIYREDLLLIGGYTILEMVDLP